MVKKFLSLILAILLFVSAIPLTVITALADEIESLAVVEQDVTEDEGLDIGDAITIPEEEQNDVSTIDYIPGDVNGDGVVNGKDVTLIRRFNAGYDVEINKLAADVNNDGVINGKDVTLVRRNNAGYDVELLPGKCEHVEVIDEAVLPTCTTTGLTEGSHCSICKAVIVEQVDIPTIGHDYVSGKCTSCGDELVTIPLEVTSVSVDKTLLMAHEEVTFSAVTNKDSSLITITASIYLDGMLVARISDVGDLKYSPTTAGRYDVEVAVTDDGVNYYTCFLKSCFDVKEYWSLNQFVVDTNKATLGEILTFSSDIDGDITDLKYEITVYKDGKVCYSVEDMNQLAFYPNAAGTYYAEFVVTDSYGERQTVQSGNVVVTAPTTTNPVFNVNYGTTLNIDELNGKTGEEVIVPSGKNIVLNWNKLTTDSYYTVYVEARSNDSDPLDETFKNYTSNTYTIPASQLIPGHEYRVTVLRYDASGTRDEDFDVTFTVGGAESILLESRFEVYTPIKNGDYAYDDITVQWSKLNYASKYVLSLEYNCGVSYHYVLENIEISGSQNYYTISKSLLHQGCKHRVKVYAYDALGNKLSQSIVFNIEGDKAIFEMADPEITSNYFYDEWTDDMKSYPVYEDIVLTWTDIPVASYYSITIKSHYSVIDAPIWVDADHIEDNMFIFPIDDLVSGCVYSVRVTAYCSDGHKCTSERKYFRVPYANGTSIYGPEVTSHDFSKDENDPTCMVEQPLTITWAPVSAATTYNVSWAEVGYEDWPDYEVKGITTTTVTIPRDCIYTWEGYADFRLKIVAKDSNGVSETTYYYIRMLESTIDTPVISSPILATDDQTQLPSFDDDFTITWNAVKGAVSYRVRIYEYYDDGYDEIYTQEGITTTSFEIPIDELYEGGQFKLVLSAYDQYGNSARSRYYFVIGAADYVGLTVNNWKPSYESDYKFTFIETVGDWTAKASDSWITVSNTSGTGTTRLKISVTENTGSNTRSGRVTFTNANGGVAVFSITQPANSSSQTSVIQIVSPSQNEVVANDVVTAKWTVKYGYAYFELDLIDLTDGRAVYHQSDITALYHQIPAQYIQQGHTYQLVLSIFDYSETKGSETSIVFKIEGEIIPPKDDTDDEESGDSGSESENTSKECKHIEYQKQLVNTVYTNLIKTSTSHDGYYLYNKTCISCGQSLDNEKVFFTNRAHNVNSKGYCECGYIDTTAYSSWTAVNDSDAKAIVYQTPESSAQYGYINAGEEVKVLGECCGRYLIQYSLDNGSGVKHGYVNMNSISKEQPKYSIYIDDEYFNAPANAMVVEKHTYYQIYIKNNVTGELIKYGTDGLVCTSSDETVVTVGGAGTMVIRSVGSSNIQLVQNGVVLDSLMVYGCVDNTILTNYSAIHDSELFEKGFAPNCRLKVFNYQSVFVADASKPGGGYYKVTFDVYNDVPTIFCVGAFDNEGNVIKQTLIAGYTADMYNEMVSTFVHFGDWFNGAMISGESEMYSKKTHVELDVPLGGYVDFLTLTNSDYMVCANILSGVVVGALETTDAWKKYISVATMEIDIDEMKFGQLLLEKICKESGMSASESMKKIVDLTWKANDYAALTTDIMGFISDSGVTLECLFDTLMQCCDSMTKDLISGMFKSMADTGLTLAIPPAGAIKKLNDAVIQTLQFAIVIKDVSSMANRTSDFLIIQYPNSQIVFE